VQTAASAGESLAAGVIFTFPALIIMSEDDDDSDLEGWGHFRYVETVVIAIAGGACLRDVLLTHSLIHSFTRYLHTNAFLYSLVIVAGLMGIMFSIPIRRALILDIEPPLAFPEGVACANVLK
jgi:uncharacterized oligopeptide transporter (OPT) family protein